MCLFYRSRRTKEIPLNNKNMIEIKKRNGVWEAYVDGGLFHYDDDLESLLQYLARNVENIKDEFYE